MEFELDDYRTGRIKKKVRNLNCVNTTAYNTNASNNKYKKKKIENKTENIVNKSNKNNIEKPIYVNSKNNNYLITKLKKENESLRLRVSEYESNIIKYKINEKKIRQKKIENEVRITRKSTNVKPQQLLTKSSNNITNFANNTFTTNFYHPKNNNKFNTNNNSLFNNSNKINDSQHISNAKMLSMNSYIVHNKKIIKNRSKKALSVFRSSSKNKLKNNQNKSIYDKVKTNYKKIINNPNSNVFDNNISDSKLKDKRQEFNNNYSTNTRVHTLNNNLNNSNYISSKNVFTYKKKVNHNTDNNVCNTERKKTEANNNSSTHNENINIIHNNNLNRNTVFIPNSDFNLTWSKFPKKGMEASFENYMTEKIPPQSMMMSSKNIKKIENNKYITKGSSKNKYSAEKFNNSNIKEKKDVTPQKITINRRVVTNKLKNNKNFFVSNNVSMKNIINIHQKNKKNGFEDNKNIHQSINACESNKIMNINNHFINEGQIYTHKKKNSMYSIDPKNNHKYNVTINNINNCNYYNLIQGANNNNNKQEIKIVKKRSNKNS